MLSDGERTLTVVLTEAQYDVLQSALDTAWVYWTNERYRDRQTLLRASKRLQTAWSQGIRS